MESQDERAYWKPVVFMGTSRSDLQEFPANARRRAGFALEDVQRGVTPRQAKPLRGFSGSSVQEIIADDTGGTYRLVYTIAMREAVYVLHAFQKKSTIGVKTSPRDIQDIKARLADALRLSRKYVREQGEHRDGG